MEINSNDNPAMRSKDLSHKPKDVKLKKQKLNPVYSHKDLVKSKLNSH